MQQIKNPELTLTTCKIKKVRDDNTQYKLFPYHKDTIGPETLLHKLRHRPNQAPNQPPNQVKVLISITMYAQEMKDFLRTMRGVVADAEYMFSNEILTPEELLVIIVSDGLDRLNIHNFLHHMEHIGAYDEKLLEEKGFIREVYKVKKNQAKKRKGGCFKKKQREQQLEEEKQVAEEDLVKKYKIKQDLYENKPGEKQKTMGNALHCFQVEGMRIFSCNDCNGPSVVSQSGINFIFAVKHLNGGKLNSHFFLFRGFCDYFKPKYTVLIDIGTEPCNRAITQLLQKMEKNRNIGGVCGSIEIDVEKTCRKSCIKGLVVYSQFYEYKLSNFLDKAAQNLFGFISVLPGAFSAYRMKAISGVPLREYFEGLNSKSVESPFNANMYLAQDRIMSLELVTKKQQKYTLGYLPGAVALTDPVETVGDLMRQRRRWINGSNFAQFYVIKHFCRLRETSHNCCRRGLINIFYVYYLINSLLGFLVVGMLYFSFSIVLRSFFSERGYDFTVSNPDSIDAYPHGNTPLVIIFEVTYLCLLFQTLLLSLAVDMKSATCQLKCISVTFGIMMLFFLFIGYFYFFFAITSSSSSSNSSSSSSTSQETEPVSSATQTLVAASIIIVILSMILPVLCYCLCYCRCKCMSLIRTVMAFLCYLFMIPTFVNMLTIYAYCNTHDISWGTKGLTGNAQQSNKEDKFRKFRYDLLMFWIFINMLCAYFLTQLVRRGAAQVILTGFAIFLAFTLIFRLIASLLSFCFCRSKFGKNKKIEGEEEDADQAKVELSAGDKKRRLKKKESNIRQPLPQA